MKKKREMEDGTTENTENHRGHGEKRVIRKKATTEDAEKRRREYTDIIRSKMEILRRKKFSLIKLKRINKKRKE